MTAQKTMTARSWAELILLGTIWGGSFVSNRIALGPFDVMPTVAFRLTGACLVLSCGGACPCRVTAAAGVPLPSWGS